MDLKNAVAVCLISLFSATLVVLIVRALDSQTASRLEPQLASIVEELQALRKQGGVAAAPGTAAKNETAADGLVVYYFHSTTRCPTCQAIESQAQETVQTHFASQLKSGEMTWKTLNFEKPEGAQLADKFKIEMPVVVLAKVKGGQIQDGWKRLDKVWALVGDKPAFAKFIQDEIKQMLASEKEPPGANPKADVPTIPIPKTDAPGVIAPKNTSEIPIPVPE